MAATPSTGLQGALPQQQHSVTHHEQQLLPGAAGIQARSGCSCAGPYAHALLGVDGGASQVMAQLAEGGEACVKGGWTRVSLSFSGSPLEVDYLAEALHQVRGRPAAAAAAAAGGAGAVGCCDLLSLAHP